MGLVHFISTQIKVLLVFWMPKDDKKKEEIKKDDKKKEEKKKDDKKKDDKKKSK